MRKILGTLLIGLMLTISGGIARAGPLEDGIAALNRSDYMTALQLIRPLADQGNAGAQFNLGIMYDNGQGVPQNDAEAMKWYRLAADQGHADAQYNLGVIYGSGQGVPKNEAEAMKWYRLAADQGNALAQGNLGIMYALGQGVARDYLRALMWFNLAVSKLSGDQGQQATRYRDLIAKNMTPEQIAEAQKLAREWKPTTPPPR